MKFFSVMFLGCFIDMAEFCYLGWVVYQYRSMHVFMTFATIATFQDLQGSIVDLRRILQHQGRHPECDD